MSQGDVSITLDGEGVVLRSTLRAAKEINAAFGSFSDAYRHLAAIDLSAFCVVVAAGLGKSVKDIEEKVYRNGLGDLVKPLTDYVNLLANGGRPPTPAEGDTKGEG